MDSKEEIGRRIRLARGKSKQKDFAVRLGIHPVQLSRYERGITSPRPEMLKKIAQTAEVSVDFILREEPMGEYKNKFDPSFFRDFKEEYFTTAQKKIIDNVKEILQSGNEVMIDALVANIRAFLEAIRTKKENREGT